MLPTLATTILANVEETSAGGNLFIGTILFFAIIFILLIIARLCSG